MAEEKNMPSEFIQMAKLSGKDSFVEFLNKGFPIGKLMVNVMKYNANGQKGSKMLYEVNGYIDFPEFLYLANIVKSLSPAKVEKIAKDTEIWKTQGGTNPKNAKRADGMAESRTLKIIRGSKADFMFVGVKGPGEVGPTGLIIPKGKPEATVMVPMSLTDITKVVLFIELHLQSYMNSCYTGINKYWKVNDYFTKANESGGDSTDNENEGKNESETGDEPVEEYPNHSKILIKGSESVSELKIQLENTMQIFKDFIITRIEGNSIILKVNDKTYFLKPGFKKSAIKSVMTIFGEDAVNVTKVK